MSLVRSFGASPPPPEQVARVTERVVRDGRLVVTEGQMVPVEQAVELDLPHEVVDAAPEDAKARAAALGTRLHQSARGQVRTAAVAEPAREARAEAPAPEVTPVQAAAAGCPTCGAVDDEQCRTASGNEAAKRHADRPE